MPETAKLVVVLAIICVVASGGLALVNAATAGRIADQERLKEEMLRAEALGGPGKEVEVGSPKPPIGMLWVMATMVCKNMR